MPPRNQNGKNGHGDSAEAPARAPVDNDQVAENDHTPASPNNSHVAAAKVKAAEMYAQAQQEAQPYIDSAMAKAADLQQEAQPYIDSAMAKAADLQQEAQPYIDSAKAKASGIQQKGQEAVDAAKATAAGIQQKGQDAVDAAKATAAGIQQKGQDAVDSARRTAQPYVDQAKVNAAPYVEGAKDKAQAVRRSLDKTVDGAKKFDITKSSVFQSLVVMYATLLTMIWHAVVSVACVKATVVTVRNKSASVGLSGKLWEAYSYSTVVLEHVPVVGYRAAEVIRAFVEQTVDEARRQIRGSEVEATKRAT